jgi:hypothetical protein
MSAVDCVTSPFPRAFAARLIVVLEKGETPPATII